MNRPCSTYNLNACRSLFLISPFAEAASFDKKEFHRNCTFNMQSFTVSKCKLAPVIISGYLYIFWKRLHIFKALLLFFKALYYFSKRFYYFSKRFYYFSKRFYSNFLSVSQHLFIFSKCESAPIYFLWLWVSAIYFLLPKHYSALALISVCKAHNFLIMLFIIFDILNMFQYQH